MSDPLYDFACECEALVRWERGERPSFSVGVCESLTCGYGKLDHNGYFEFPLYPAEKYRVKSVLLPADQFKFPYKL
jgi:hypothetical protein